MNRLSAFYVIFLYILGISTVAIAEFQPESSNKTNVEKDEKQTKTVKDFYTGLAGEWNGSYSLWLRPGTPAQKSDIEAKFQPVAKGNYFLMTYSWKRGKKAHEGVFLFGGDGKIATVTWGDSFHMIPAPMRCQGRLEEGGRKLIVNGNYSVSEGPDWGWRTEFTQQSSNTLLMEAYNITPTGNEALAVRAELKRVLKDEK